MMIKLPLLTLVLSLAAVADQVTLKNGDRLTGQVVRFDGKSLTFKSEFAGQVNLPWDAVTGLLSDAPVYVQLKNGQTVAGTLSLSADSLKLESREAGEVSARRESIETIRSSSEQTAWQAEIDRYRNPRLIDLWTGFLDMGIAGSYGNARTFTLNSAASATRTTTRDKMEVFFASLYARNSTTGSALITANSRRGGVKYNLNVSSRAFAFGSADIEYDEFQGLDLRFAPAGGFGIHAIAKPRSSLDLLLGASLNREFFTTGLDRTSGEGVLGQDYVYKLSERTSFQEKLRFYPNLTNRGEYRLNFDASAVTALVRWLSWQVSLSDRLLSNPLPGRKKNDMLLTTGLRITFAR